MKKRTHGIERIVLHDCEESDEGTNEKFQVVRALGYHYVGILLKRAPRVMMSCVKDMVEEHHVDGCFDEALECENNSKISMNEYGSRKGLDHRDVPSIIMYVSIYCSSCVDVCGRLRLGFDEDQESSQTK